MLRITDVFPCWHSKEDRHVETFYDRTVTSAVHGPGGIERGHREVCRPSDGTRAYTVDGGELIGWITSLWGMATPDRSAPG